MTIVCIETSTSVCSAAICTDGVPDIQCMNNEGSNHARLLPRYMEQLLRYAREHNRTIDAVAFSEGPGSYTGLRIGAATAKGLCYGMDIPLIPVPTLQLMALAAEKQLERNRLPLAGSTLVPMIDARRMEVYTALFPAGQASLGGQQARAVVVEGEQSLVPANAATPASDCEARYYYFGDGADKCRALLPSPRWQFLPGIVPEAQYMGELAMKADRRLHGAETAYYEPFYLKDFIAAPSHVKGLK